METVTYYRPTKITVDLHAIQSNIENFKKQLLPNVQLIAVVKANAYGHGDVEVARTAIEAGASMLAVATPEEAVHLREYFPSIGILLLGASPVQFAEVAARLNISLTVFSVEWLEQLELDSFPTPLKVHIKVDTGMGRIGVTTAEEFKALYQFIKSKEQLELEGMFTHFATADEEDASYFRKQAEKFESMLSLCSVKPKIVHVANTATALAKDKAYQYDAVRFGISMYGLAPSDYVETVLPFKLERAMSLETELVHVKELNPGEGVGYGASFIAEVKCIVGTLPIGYADGLIRKLSGQDVLIDGKRVPIIGRICMDQCMILLPKAYNVGEKVQLIGKQGSEEITFDEWAKRIGTINYELPCILTSRIPRFYT